MTRAMSWMATADDATKLRGAMEAARATVLEERGVYAIKQWEW